VAENGADGLDAARKENPDLIIVDLMLPGMDGHALCRELKGDPDTSHIPVVILTCRNRAEDVELARKEQVDAYILKSMMSKVLVDVLNRILKRQKKE
jgi:CheY-like chemotaxis protein